MNAGAAMTTSLLQVLDAESKSDHYTLLNRFNLANELLDGLFAAGVCPVWAGACLSVHMVRMLHAWRLQGHLRCQP